MPIVTIRNKSNHEDLAGFDLDKNCIVSLHTQYSDDCGDFIRLDDGTIVGFLNASIENKNFDEFLFFIGEKVFDFKDKRLSSSVEYFSKEQARFILNRKDEEVINIVYPRSISSDFGGWLVGNWETEKEKDIFMNIHEIINR